MRRNKFSVLMLSISALAVAACSGGQQGVESSKVAAPTPPVINSSDTLTPITSTSVTTTSTVTPIEDRIAKLENAVGSLRTDYDRIMPAFASLNTTNERIQTLLDEIESQGAVPTASKTTKTTVTTTATTTPAPLTAADIKTTGAVAPSPEVMDAMDASMATKTVTTTTATAVSATAKAVSQTPITGIVKGVRIGEHGSKTRFVIDLGASIKPEVAYDLDNTEKLLLVDLPASQWNGAKTGTPKNSTFVTSWSVQDGAKGGSALAIQLKKNAKIQSTEYLKAQGKDPARLVIDIGPAT